MLISSQRLYQRSAVRVLLEIDGRADADGDGEQDQQDAEEDRREDRGLRAGDRGVGRRRLEEQDGVHVLPALEEDL